MSNYFSLDSTYNSLVKQIADTIKETYAQGYEPGTPEYDEYPGKLKANKIICENIGPPDMEPGHFAKLFSALLKDLKQTLGKDIIGTTYGFTPGLSADLILKRYEDDSLKWVKRIAFAVSMIGPFFSICGIDETFIKEGENASYHAINAVTTSPYKEFESDFNYIRQQIEEFFLGYKFIPFTLCMKRIQNVQTANSMGLEGTIYNALFNHLFNFYTHSRSRGDAHYGYEKNNKITVTLLPPPQDS